MKRELFQYFYEHIKSRYIRVETSLSYCRDDVKELAKKYPEVGYNTLFCIYSQKYQEMTRKTLHKHRRPENIARYYER
jgi:uncharacterized SAM-dependent methyltransferase